MFVCMCRAVTLSRVRSVVEDGAASLDAIEAACGAGGDCGTCRAELADVLDAHCPANRQASEAA
jgi:bacterioferritin-associated ferredoxin